MSINDGGPAFPCEVPAPRAGIKTTATGLSLRDYFAAKAMAALLPVYVEANEGGVGSSHLYRNLPTHAYRMADAMLREREE